MGEEPAGGLHVDDVTAVAMFANGILPTITTERLALRWLTDDDVPALFEIFSDPLAMRYWSSPPLPNLDGARALLDDIRAHFAARTLFQWGIATLVDDRIIGTCTLAQFSITHKRAELGYAIARSEWGRGYASEATAAIVRFAFDHLGLHRLEADVDPRNHASVRCLEKLGFRREGFLRERYHMYDEIQDAALYGLLRSDR